jgi:Xaa-Pro dipeptidase
LKLGPLSLNYSYSQFFQGMNLIMADQFTVDIQACRGRQQRLLAELARLGLEYAVFTRPESVQWLTVAFLGPMFTSAVGIDHQGSVTAIVPRHAEEISLAADEVIPFDAQLQATFTENQASRSAQALIAKFARLPKRVGCEYSSLHQYWTEAWQAEWIDLEPTILRFRRQKDPDELRMLSRANEANRAMFQYARENIRPEINELELYNSLQAVAVRQLGEPLTYFGHDFQCGSIGGPPRNRTAEAGELYILDLGVGFRGYHSDNARTFAVGTSVSEPQQQAWNALKDVFQFVEASVKPGVSCSELYAQVQEMLAAHRPWKFEHHLGHGVGLSAHETPRLNPEWDDHFEEGDFFTAEPGLYHEDLNFGLRLEQNYLVTSAGVQLMTDWPLEL